MMPRRSSRTKIKPKPSVTRPTLKQGYYDFRAEETDDSGDGSYSTAVVLAIGAQSSYNGTSNGIHAEMDALNQMLTAYQGTGTLEEFISDTTKTVSCTSKPCCFRCSVVLGLFKFRPAADTTKKIKKGMGLTEWFLPEGVKTALNETYGTSIQDTLNSFSNIDKL
jgi:hypothetical protein